MIKQSKNQTKITYKDINNILEKIEKDKSKNITIKEILQILKKIKSLDAYESANITSAISSILSTKVIVRKAIKKPKEITRETPQSYENQTIEDLQNYQKQAIENVRSYTKQMRKKK